MSGPEIGNAGTVGQLWQSWTLVSDDEAEYKQFLTGWIDKIHLNAGQYFHDFDWCIYVTPDPPYTELLKNSADEQNENGQIELEVKSPGYADLGLSDKFPPGTWIQAYGWWVEDSGHSAENHDLPAGAATGRGKTELHPLIYMIAGGLDSYRLKIFMCPDVSCRFVTQGWPMYQSFDLPIAGTPKPIDLLNPYVGTTHVLEETAVVDNTTKSMGSDDEVVLAQWEASRTRVIASMDPGLVHLSVDMAVPGVVGPLYLGDFQRSIASLLAVEVDKSVSVGPPPDCFKNLKFRIKATLANPEPDELAYSKWIYQESSAFQTTIANTKTLKSADLAPGEAHRIEYDLIYGPGEGWNDTCWALDVMGSTRSADWSPGKRTDASQTGLGAPEMRKFTQDRVVLGIEPSRVSVKAEEIFGSRRTVGPPDPLHPDGDYTQCVLGYRITLEEKLIPGIAGEIGWRLAVVCGTDGEPMVSPDVRDIPTDGTWAAGVDIGYGVTVICDAASDHEVTVFFKAMDASLVQSGDYWLTSTSNHTRLVVTGYVETELGEIPEDSTAELCRPGCGLGITVGQFFENLVKAEIAATLLRDLGLYLSQWRPGTDPPPELTANWPPPSHTVPGTMRGLYRSLSGRGRRLLVAYRDFVNGRPVADRDLKGMVVAVDRGSRLPALEIARPPRRPLPILRPEAMPVESTSPLRLERGQTFLLSDIQFRGNTAALARGAAAELKKWSWILQANSEAKVLVAAYTDNTSPPRTSRRLSQKRAETLMRYLVRTGVDPSRLTAIGYGEADPRASNETAAGRKLNERIEFHIR